jgi:glycosyltransferase involved in cell wall biosynthesis
MNTRTGLRLALFGDYHPNVERVAPATTGLSILISRHPGTRALRLYVPVGSTEPSGLETSVARLVPCWRVDDAPTLIRTLVKMWIARHELDLYLFNMFVTSFGRKRVVNGIGLLLPVFVRLSTGRPVWVYMHNFAETQDISKLGYHPGRVTSNVVKALERMLLSLTEVIVPLRSQQERVASAFGITPRQRFLPHIDAIVPILLSEGAVHTDRRDGTELIEILLFGSWGPQKDLESALYSLFALVQKGLKIHVVLAGGVNPSFPEYRAKVESILSRFPEGCVTFYRNASFQDVPQESVPSLFNGVDVLLLPYNAAGGYSSIMNIGAALGACVICYPDPQLEETAQELRANVTFVPRGDVDALENALLRLKRSNGTPKERVPTTDAVDAAKTGVANLLRLIQQNQHGK